MTGIATPEPPSRAAWFRRLLQASEGGAAVEYAMTAGLIALVIVGALADLGAALRALPLPALVAAFQDALS